MQCRLFIIFFIDILPGKFLNLSIYPTIEINVNKLVIINNSNVGNKNKNPI